MNQREQHLKSFCFEQADLYFSQEKNEPSFCWELFWKHEVVNTYNASILSNLAESLKTGTKFTPFFLNDKEGSEDYKLLQSIQEMYFKERNIHLIFSQGYPVLQGGEELRFVILASLLLSLNYYDCYIDSHRFFVAIDIPYD